MEENKDQSNTATTPNNKNKFVIFAVILVIVVAGSFLLGKQSSAPSTEDVQDTTSTSSDTAKPDTTTSSNTTNTSPTPVKTTPTGETNFGAGEVNTLGKQPAVLVTLTDNGFSPLSLQIKVGQPVIFTNQSTSGMWVASDPHPSHTNYAGFDQNKVVFRGESYELFFLKAGTWKYHNHVNPGQTGTLIVK